MRSSTQSSTRRLLAWSDSMAYAAAYLDPQADGPCEVDALTLSPYLGAARLDIQSPTRKVIGSASLRQTLIALAHISGLVADDQSLEVTLFRLSNNYAADSPFCVAYITPRHLSAVVGIHALFEIRLVPVKAALHNPGSLRGSHYNSSWDCGSTAPSWNVSPVNQS